MCKCAECTVDQCDISHVTDCMQEQVLQFCQAYACDIRVSLSLACRLSCMMQKPNTPTPFLLTNSFKTLLPIDGEPGLPWWSRLLLPRARFVDLFVHKRFGDLLASSRFQIDYLVDKGSYIEILHVWCRGCVCDRHTEIRWKQCCLGCAPEPLV